MVSLPKTPGEDAVDLEKILLSFPHLWQFVHLLVPSLGSPVHREPGLAVSLPVCCLILRLWQLPLLGMVSCLQGKGHFLSSIRSHLKEFDTLDTANMQSSSWFFTKC